MRNRRYPRPGILAQRPAPGHRTHRTHDTTDQWREIFGGWGESRLFGLPSTGVTDLRPEWWRASRCLLVHFRKTNGFLQDMDSLCSSHLTKIMVL